MKSSRFTSNIPVVALLALAFTSLASAQAARTWVSSGGNDGNPCSRTSPCATFAGAISKTLAGGEIDCVDSNDYGTLTITKSISIDCGGTFGAMLVPTSSVGISVNAGASDSVTIRNLSLVGATPQNATGLVYLSAQAVHLENVRLSGFGTCVAVETTSSSLLTVDNATISDCGGSGVFVNTTTGTAVTNINNTRISNTATAVEADNGARVTIHASAIFFNNFGVGQNAAGGGSVVTSVGTVFGYSGVAALQSKSGQFILAFGNSFVNDVIIYNPNGGQIFTGSDNVNSGSATGTANGGSLPKV